MSGNRRPAIVGAATLAVATASLVFAFTAQRGVPGRTYTMVNVAFDDVGPALRAGNDVRQQGVRIGQVKAIGFAGGKPRVTLQLDGDREIYSDATAVVSSRSALGQKYVTFAPGHADKGRLPDGKTLTPGVAGSATDLDALLDVFDPATRKALGSAIRDLGGGTAGHSRDINDALSSAPGLLDDAAGVSAALTDDQAHLAELLADARRLSSRLTDKQAQIAGALGHSATTLGALGVDGGAPLKATLRELPRTLQSANTAMAGLRAPLADLQATVTTLRPGAEAVGQDAEQVRATLRAYVAPLNRLQGLAPSLDTSVVSLSGLMADARPFAPKLRRAVTLASTSLSALAPYSPEAALWFQYAKSALAGSDENGHWLRFDILGNSETGSGSGPLGTTADDPVVSRNPYPAPGEAQRQNTNGGSS